MPGLASGQVLQALHRVPCTRYEDAMHSVLELALTKYWVNKQLQVTARHEV